MYLNVVCLKCGKTIPFQSKVPYSVDKVSEGWNLITDENNGQIISVRGSEIVSICSQDTSKVEYKSLIKEITQVTEIKVRNLLRLKLPSLKKKWRITKNEDYCQSEKNISRSLALVKE